MNLVQIQSPAHLVNTIQSLATGSFERKFANLKTVDVVNAFALATQGLTIEQIHTGLNTLLEFGYCPDAVLFRRWCLGQKTIDHTDHIADSYIGKAGALANIIKWLSDDATPITVAQKQAYDETFHMFAQISYAGSATQATYEAHSAYKDTYEHIVNKLVKERVPCQDYIPPVAISQSASQPQEIKHIPASDEFVSQLMAKYGFNKIGML